MMEDSCHMQLISGDRVFDVLGLRGFMNSTKFHECGLSYSVVAIIGPQSSGKSTLFNHLFHTNFPEMNALLGRTKTTRGIWLAKAADAIQPFTLVMDLEGTDGREKEDDTAFEKQSCLFALAVADIVLINMWCHDIGRQQAANVPLLETVFKVMLQLFSPRKTTLLFVIRDKTETPPSILESILREDIHKIWKEVPKPPQHKDTTLSDFFNVEFIALSSKEKEEEFKEQVVELRHKYFRSPSPADRWGVVPASGFSLNAENIWKTIKENKDLDLPALKIMVATVRCEEIANDKFNYLESSEDWVALKRAVATGEVSGFGRIGSSILNKCLSEYDSESMYYNEDVRKARREHLRSKALQLLKSWFIKVVNHLRSITLEHFKTELEIRVGRGEGFANSVIICQQASMLKFRNGCSDATIEQANWHASGAQPLQDIKDHASRVGDEKLSQVQDEFKNKLCEALSQPVVDLFEDGKPDTWASIRKLVRSESDAAASGFSFAIRGFALGRSRVERMVAELEEHAIVVVERKSREVARRVKLLMINRFHAYFNDALGIGRDNISAITREGQLECLKLLSTMAVIRLDDDSSDNVLEILNEELMRRNDITPSRNMASETWDQVPPEKTLITPDECRELWRRFKAETECRSKQALSAPEGMSTLCKALIVAGGVVGCVAVGAAVACLIIWGPAAAVPAVIGVIATVGAAVKVANDGPSTLAILFALICSYSAVPQAAA